MPTPSPSTRPAPPSAGTLVDLEDVRADVDASVESRVRRLADELAHVGDATGPLLEEAGHLLRGGKRLRAAFCYWSWRAHAGDPADRPAVIGASAALELFQAAALVHDDVMDRSDTRRGRPSAHRAFAAAHRAEGWLGDADDFGTSAAILLGDVLLIACNSQFADVARDVDPASGLRARELFDHMQTEVTVGQFLDVRAQSVPWGEDPAAAEQRARAVIRAKSARYSVEHPTTIGAALAGAAPDAIARAAAFGLPVGEAFQLRDDLLGVFGDPAVTGKPAGDDLREGKRTVLLCRALQHADRAGRALILGRVGDPDLTQADVDDLRTVVDATGATAAVEGLIDELTATGLAALEEAGLGVTGLDATAARTLHDLAVAATRRTA
ncbi:geranylgeranyl diphosphate synthase type I [Sediminihabitans luteus]|uniref:Geranylgeranyl diphosphate synthase type I n=1 Tax=Sediminihabitans luteus TaxID=1138585 RepID=A0A2M9CQF4_9CELL|nr:polyprenyl synthetase family protein [Sediminihabitans luteus]PJJ74061.1 geranylgeranyl diphosphate synthase type I [Sediminihabitans luteus]